MDALDELSNDPRDLHTLVEEVRKDYSTLRCEYERLQQRHRALERYSARLERSLTAVCSLRGIAPAVGTSSP